MNDLVIKVSKRSRLIDLDHSTLGIVGENLQEKLIFTFQDEFVDGMARLEYELAGDKRYVLMDKVGQSYILPVQNVLLSKEGNIDLQLVVTQDETGTPVFKSEVFTLYCKKSIEAVGEAPSSYELWIEKANRILLEASRVNIDGKKTGNETIITITQRDGNKKNFSILDGQNGQDGQDGNGIVSIEKTSTSTLVDTYTITFTDGTTTTFEVTNGNGIVSIEKTSTSGLVDTYTITFTDGTTTTYTVTNGETPDLSNYVQKPEFNASQAEQDTTIEGLQAELERYKLLENALPHTENETESDYVTLENTAKSPMTIETIPQTSQDGEPTPDNPQEINRTTGENEIKVVGKNLFSGDYSQFTSTGGTGNLYGYFKIPDDNETYTLSITAKKDFAPTSSQYIGFTKSGGQAGQGFVWLISGGTSYTKGQKKEVINYQGSVRLDYVSIYSNNANTLQTLVENFDIQLEKGSSATSYTPYEETTYPISLGTKEMYNINGVYDGFVYDENEDKFYINRNIGKVVLNGGESWVKIRDYVFTNRFDNCLYPASSTVLMDCLCDKFTRQTNSSTWNNYSSLISYYTQTGGNTTVFRYDQTKEISDWTSWLSTHNTIVVYQLATSTLEEITGTTLISQLRAIKDALSMQGTTHIISTSSGTNLPFLIKARAVQTIERT